MELFEAEPEIGGQFQLARRVPGKEEFAETLRYFTRRLELTGVKVRLGHAVTAAELADGGYDDVIVATGVSPRTVELPGADRSNVHSYADVITGTATVGPRVAVMGAGGIGFDVSEFLTHAGSPVTAAAVDRDAWLAEWGVGDPAVTRGGLTAPEPQEPARQVYLLQRKTSQGRRRAGQDDRLGAPGDARQPRRRDAQGRHLRAHRRRRPARHGRRAAAPRVLEVDDVVVCAGQEPRRELADALRARRRATRCTSSAEPTSPPNSTPSGRSTRAPGSPPPSEPRHRRPHVWTAVWTTGAQPAATGG